MAQEESQSGPLSAVGIEFHHSDGTHLPPKTHDLGGAEIQKWFMLFPELKEDINFKILALRIDRHRTDTDATFLNVRFAPETVEHAFWSPDGYYKLSQDRAGGCSALLDDPPRFMLQTPLDGGPHCSLAMTKRGYSVKGIYTYDDDMFEPVRIAANERSLSGWRSSGFQIVSMPQAILRAHSAYLGAQLAKVVDSLKAVEAALVNPSVSTNFAPLNRRLHGCSTQLVNLERRSRFEQQLIAAIEEMVVRYQTARSMPWADIAPQKSAIEARRFDFEGLPRRIENARAAIAAFIQQRNEQMNLEIAEASHRMTEIALSDNASMRTIAILTMVFLPGTAVASFFSMTMFNWEPGNNGGQIASTYLWIYFVVSIPLTGMVLAVWWVWGHRLAIHRRRHTGRRATIDLDDIELIRVSHTSDDDARANQKPHNA